MEKSLRCIFDDTLEVNHMVLRQYGIHNIYGDACVCLELVRKGMNTIHKTFVHTYDAYDIRISAYDIDILKDRLEKKGIQPHDPEAVKEILAYYEETDPDTKHDYRYVA